MTESEWETRCKWKQPQTRSTSETRKFSIWIIFPSIKLILINSSFLEWQTKKKLNSVHTCTLVSRAHIGIILPTVELCSPIGRVCWLFFIFFLHLLEKSNNNGEWGSQLRMSKHEDKNPIHLMYMNMLSHSLTRQHDIACERYFVFKL